MSKIAVLMSTFNGTEYVREQIDSIYKQTFKDFRLYIRDDGSDETFVKYLRNLQKEYGFELYTGDNIGFGRSFMTLLEMVDDAEYYAFSDQDDVWMPDKLEMAIEWMKKNNGDIPVMYFHNFILTDEYLKETGIYNNRIKNYSFQMAITECLHMGFATVINSKLREYMLRGNLENITSHDWWAELIVMEFGLVHTDDYIGAKHRRLNDSLSSGSLHSRIKWFFGALKGKSDIDIRATEFLNVFKNEMDNKDRIVLEWFDFKNYSLSSAIKKGFFVKRWRSSIFSEFALRLLMLIGKI